jgi:hypothetical protein
MLNVMIDFWQWGSESLFGYWLIISPKARNKPKSMMIV